MTTYDETTDFAWIITRDHLHESDKETFSDETGTTGPFDSPDDLTDYLKKRYMNWPAKAMRPESGKQIMRYRFHMYDDDNILYYTGVLAVYVSENTDFPSDEAQMAPLYDFGGPNAGATVIKYTDHPEWTIEY